MNFWQVFYWRRKGLAKDFTFLSSFWWEFLGWNFSRALPSQTTKCVHDFHLEKKVSHTHEFLKNGSELTPFFPTWKLGYGQKNSSLLARRIYVMCAIFWGGGIEKKKFFPDFKKSAKYISEEPMKSFGSRISRQRSYDDDTRTFSR